MRELWRRKRAPAAPRPAAGAAAAGRRRAGALVGVLPCIPGVTPWLAAVKMEQAAVHEAPRAGLRAGVRAAELEPLLPVGVRQGLAVPCCGRRGRCRGSSSSLGLLLRLLEVALDGRGAHLAAPAALFVDEGGYELGGLAAARQAARPGALGASQLRGTPGFLDARPVRVALLAYVAPVLRCALEAADQCCDRHALGNCLPYLLSLLNAK